MSKMFADVQPAVRKETKKVAIGTFVCVVLMWAVDVYKRQTEIFL